MYDVAPRGCQGGVQGGGDGYDDVVLGSVDRVPGVDDAVVGLQISR